jgi:hypothetical protein
VVTRTFALFVLTAALVGVLVAAVWRAPPEPEAGTGAVAGRVVHAMTGRPAIGVTIIAEPVMGSASGPGVSDPSAAARAVETGTDAAGRFTLPSLAPGHYTVHADHTDALGAFGQTRPGASPAVLSILAGQMVDNVLVPLWPGSEISGAVFDAHDRPLAGTTVRIMSAADETAWVAVTSDRGGRYHAGRLWPGRYRVVVPITREHGAGRVHAGGAEPLTLLTTFAPDTPDPAAARLVDLGVGVHQRGVDVRLRAAPAASLSGVIEAEPVPGTFFRLRLFRSRELDRLDLADAWLRVDEPGEFVMRALPRASYTLEVERQVEGSEAMVYWPLRVPVDLRDGGAAVRVRFGDDTPLDTTVEVDATIARRVTTLRGQVRDTTGSEARNVVVVAFPVDQERWVESGAVPDRLVVQPLNEDGTYAIRGLPSGAYLVRAVNQARLAQWPLPYVLARLAGGATRLTLEAGESRRLDLDVR